MEAKSIPKSTIEPTYNEDEKNENTDQIEPATSQEAPRTEQSPTPDQAGGRVVPVYCAYTDLVAPGSLEPSPDNPNKHPAYQVEILAKLIARHGWRRPVTVSMRSGRVTKGHGALQAAVAINAHHEAGDYLDLEKKEKWPSTPIIPVDYQNYGSEAEEKADMIADNRVMLYSKMEPEALAPLMKTLDLAGYDLSLTAMMPEEITGLLELKDLDINTLLVDDFKQAPQITVIVTCPKCGHEFNPSDSSRREKKKAPKKSWKKKDEKKSGSGDETTTGDITPPKERKK